MYLNYCLKTSVTNREYCQGIHVGFEKLIFSLFTFCKRLNNQKKGSSGCATPKENMNITSANVDARSTFLVFCLTVLSLFGTQVSFWILYICNISSQLSERTGQEGVDQPINALTRYPLALHLKTQVDQRWEMGYLCRLPFVWSQRRRSCQAQRVLIEMEAHP